jgi:hypothetical protein
VRSTPKHPPNTLFAESCARALNLFNPRRQFHYGLMQTSSIGSKSRVLATRRESMPSCVRTKTKLPDAPINADAPVRAGYRPDDVWKARLSAAAESEEECLLIAEQAEVVGLARANVEPTDRSLINICADGLRISRRPINTRSGKGVPGQSRGGYRNCRQTSATITPASSAAISASQRLRDLCVVASACIAASDAVEGASSRWWMSRGNSGSAATM